jgi:hypothetical protein
LLQSWRQWTNGAPLELVDASLGDSYTRNEITRCIHIGLLCVQEDPNDRPTMTTIVLMLSSFSITLPLPREPAYFVKSRNSLSLPIMEPDSDQSTSKSKSLSANDMSITELYPRWCNKNNLQNMQDVIAYYLTLQLCVWFFFYFIYLHNFQWWNKLSIL